MSILHSRTGKEREMKTVSNKLSRIAVGTVLMSSTVFAQPTTSPSPVPAPTAAATSPGPGSGGEVDISVGQKPTLTVDEMISQSREYQQGMGQVIKRIQTLQETARKQKDIIKLNCVADKLVQGKVNVSIADQALTSLQENISRADEGGRTHEFTRLTIINQKVTVLGAEAENCIGEDLSFVGATRIDVDVDPNIPKDDPTQPGVATTNIDRPPASSTYR
jgi:hypothetical protein